jgi:hypothetical protein
MKKQVEATKELIPTLTKNHTRQIEMLIKNTTEAMKEMMQLIKSKTKTPFTSNETKEEKKKKRVEKRKKYNEAPICKHCIKSTNQKRKMNAGNCDKQSFPPK